MGNRYLRNFDIKSLIHAATANIARNQMTFLTGSGILLYLEFVFLILNLLSNPVVYKGNMNTVTYIIALQIP